MFTLLQGQLASLVEANNPLSGGLPLGFLGLIFLFYKVEVIWSWAEMGSKVWWPTQGLGQSGRFAGTWSWRLREQLGSASNYSTFNCVISGGLLHFSGRPCVTSVMGSKTIRTCSVHA